MADDLDGIPSTLTNAAPAVIEGVFDHMVLQEWPDGSAAEPPDGSSKGHGLPEPLIRGD
jgi:hypothetical protein